MKKPNLNIKLIIISVIGASIIGSIFYYIGFSTGFAQTKTIEIAGIRNGANPANNDTDFSVFWQAWDTLKSRHINGKDISNEKLLQGAMKGLAEAFDDPYTVYFNPADSKKFNEEVRGNFGGIGTEIGIRNDQLMVITPLKDTPAEAAGLRAKDMILEIDGKSTANMTIDQAVKLIRGTPGTKVVLTIFREEWEETRKIEIIRQNIQVPTIEADLDSNGILHLSLFQFNENAERLFGQAVLDAVNKGAKGMVLDLRNDPGGYLEVAVDLAGWFVKRGSVVVVQKSSSGQTTEMRTYGNEALLNFPIVTLINEGSASASEILAGALRDIRGVKIVGVKSFGKGTVQELDDLKDGSTLKVTIANWLTPKGTVIEKNGIEPDYKVELDEEKLRTDEIDTQLQKAKEVLRSQIK